MNEWLGLAALVVVCIVSIYLIAKGVEIFVRGSKASNPNRVNDLLFGAFLIVPGVLAGLFGFFWLLPRL